MNNWKVPSYTRRDGNKACWVVEDKPRPKSICRCFGPKGEEHAEYIVLACNAYGKNQEIIKDLLAACEWINAFIGTASDCGEAWCAVRNQLGAREWAKGLGAAIEKATP